MTDTHTKEQRSYNMSRIKSKDTKPELLVRKFLFNRGFRYRLHTTNLPGKPDIVLSKYKTIIFINGCFWHGHEGCDYFVVPKSNRSYWLPKIERNIERDTCVRKELKELGWKILIVWECQLKDNIEDKLQAIIDYLLFKEK